MKMMMQQQQQQNLEAAASVTSPSSTSSRPSTTASVAALVMPEQGNLSKGIDNKTVKGQLILKCPFGVFKSPKKTNKCFSRISALASKKRSNQKDKGTLYH